MRAYTFISLLFMAYPLTTYGQEFSELTWKNRIIVMVADDASDKIFQDQTSEFSACLGDLSERKLLIYQVLPDSFRVVQPYLTPWKKSDSWYRKFGNYQGDHEILLVGLDGGIKLRKNEAISCSEISNLIDQMPMRRSEMKSK
jgi:hypothetical protein